MKGYVTVGYYKDEEKNQAAFTPDGYFRTGDLGVLDRDGFLLFRGRIKEMIKTGGINVAPAEVEEILMAAPGRPDRTMWPAYPIRCAMRSSALSWSLAPVRR